MLETDIYRPRTAPRAHQAEGLRRWGERKAFALLMAMRTGKTKVVLDRWGELVSRGELDSLLVIGPGGAYRIWEGEIQKHLGEELLARLRVATWRSGNAAARRAVKGLVATAGGPRVLLINVEALSTVAEARALCAKFLKGGRAMMAVDEASDIRNKSKRTQAVLALGELAAYRVIMSGLINPRSPLDFFYPFNFLDWRILGLRSWYGFRARYAVMQDQYFGGRRVRRVPIVVGYKNLEELQEKIAPHSYRLLLKDCSEAPPPVYSMREVELTAEQKRLYREMQENATAQLSEMEHITATAVIVQIIRLHQILCGIAIDEQGVEHAVPENRTRELLAELSDYDGKAVIWCTYDANVQRVSAALEKEFGAGTVARFWGGNRATREEEEYQFLNNPKTRFQVATPAAGGRGRTWTVADLVVYYSSSNNLEHRDQSEERVRGMDKLRPVSSVDLIAPGTVDEKIVRALRKKIDLAAAITGDGWREWLV